MILVELKESVYNKAFELIDEAKHNNKKTKLALCELEDCLENCFEMENESYDEQYNGDSIVEGDIDVEIGELNYKRGMRGGMRHDDWDMGMRRGMRRSMRRNRMSRYSY